jgi:hypothetical protein
VVNIVTAYAAHIAFAVGRVFKIMVLALVAAQAFGVNFLGCGLGGIENLSNVATAVNVRFARSVTALAGHTSLAVHLCQPGVGIGSESLDDFFMATCAGVLANILI